MAAGQTQKCDIVHPNIGFLEAEEILLANGTIGAYLLRESSSDPGQYVLCLMTGTEKLRQYKIRLSSKGKYFMEAAPTAVDRQVNEYASLETLVKSIVLKGKENGLPAPLLHPIYYSCWLEEEDEDSGDDIVEPILQKIEADSLSSSSNDTTDGSGGGTVPSAADSVQDYFTKQLSYLDMNNVDAKFMKKLKTYCATQVQADLISVQEPSTPDLQQAKRLILSESQELISHLMQFTAKVDAFKQLFVTTDTGVSNQEVEACEQISGGYENMIARLSILKSSLANFEIRGQESLKGLSEKLSSGKSLDLEIPDVTFTVKVKSGMKSTSMGVTVSIEKGCLWFNKECALNKAAEDATKYCAKDIQQLVKCSKSNVRVDILIASTKRRDALLFEDARQRENFVQMVQEMKSSHTVDERTDQISLFVGTWNMGGTPPPVQLHQWVRGRGEGKLRAPALAAVPLDVYVFGIQECGLTHDKLVGKLQSTLSQLYGRDYHLVQTATLWVMKIVILVKKEHTNKISEIQDATVATGLGNTFGNKGGVALSFNFDGTSFLFVNCHLAANREKMQRRNQNFRDIYRSLSSTLCPKNMFDITQHFDHVFWLGDLNYRVDEEIEVVLPLAENGEYDKMFALDQLEQLRTSGKFFADFVEAEITFPPTYRYKKGAIDSFDWKKMKSSGPKINAPSWCDRVLWYSHKGLKNENTGYGCVREIASSDHKPVFSSFDVEIVPQTAITQQKGGADKLTIRVSDIRAKVWTRSSEQKFEVKFFADCIEAPVQTLPSDATRSGNKEWLIHIPDACDIRPLFSDMGYLEDQHLLVAVRTFHDGEVWGKCVIPLCDIFEEDKPYKHEGNLTHLGTKTGEFDCQVKAVWMNREAKSKSATSKRKKSIYFVASNDDDNSILNIPSAGQFLPNAMDSFSNQVYNIDSDSSDTIPSHTRPSTAPPGTGTAPALLPMAGTSPVHSPQTRLVAGAVDTAASASVSAKGHPASLNLHASHSSPASSTKSSRPLAVVSPSAVSDEKLPPPVPPPRVLSAHPAAREKERDHGRPPAPLPASATKRSGAVPSSPSHKYAAGASLSSPSVLCAATMALSSKIVHGSGTKVIPPPPSKPAPSPNSVKDVSLSPGGAPIPIPPRPQATMGPRSSLVGAPVVKPADLEKLASLSQRVKRESTSTPAHPMNVNEWLLDLGLPQYIQKFFANGWDNMAFMKPLTSQDLKKMGAQEAHIELILKSLKDM